MFFHHEAGIPTIRQLKIIEEVQKLVDEKKNLYIYATLTEQTVEKQTKPLKTSRKIFSLLIALFPVRVAGAAARVQATTLHSFPLPPSFRLGEVPNNST